MPISLYGYVTVGSIIWIIVAFIVAWRYELKQLKWLHASGGDRLAESRVR